MNSSRRTTILGLIVCAATAQAGRPLVTEDAGVIDRGSCEFESFGLHATARTAPSTSATTVQVGCGIGLRTQLTLATGSARSAGFAERSLSLGGKTALNGPGPSASAGAGAWALAWGLAAQRPAGGSLKHEASFVNGVFSLPVTGELKLHANLGWSRSQSARQSTTGWALALERSGAAASVDLMGETFAHDRDKAPWVQLGLRWAAVPDKIFLDGSWGLQAASARPKMLTLGLKAAF